MRTIYLVRHGETDYVKEGRIQGIQQIPLNNKGLYQAKKVAEYFKDKNINLIITSNLMRSIQTGEEIQKVSPVNLIKFEGFNERDFGLWHNKLWSDIHKEIPDLEQQWVKEGLNFKPPEGESVKELIVRVKKTFFEVTKKYDGNMVIAIHGGPIKMIMGVLGEILEEEYYNQKFINTGEIQCISQNNEVYELGKNITLFH